MAPWARALSATAVMDPCGTCSTWYQRAGPSVADHHDGRAGTPLPNQVARMRSTSARGFQHASAGPVRSATTRRPAARMAVSSVADTLLQLGAASASSTPSTGSQVLSELVAAVNPEGGTVTMTR